MGKIRKLIRNLLFLLPKINLILIFFNQIPKKSIVNLQKIHDQYLRKNKNNTVAIDLGCGFNPQNRFEADKIYGVDLYKSKKKNILECHLGVDKLPFKDNYVDYITAYDLLEHIPRHTVKEINNPFIYLMNDVYRVLKNNGIFLTMTPIFPYPAAFKDPTHTNIISSDTFEKYFSKNKYEIASHYGIETNFEILYQGIYGEHLVTVMKK